jgi:hypothetical protein
MGILRVFLKGVSKDYSARPVNSKKAHENHGLT